MTDKEEFAARSQLKWTREGDAWILLYHRKRMGRVVPNGASAPPPKQAIVAPDSEHASSRRSLS